MLELRQLPTAAVLFVVAGIALAIGADITNEVGTDITGATAKDAAYNATAGIGELASWMPTIGLVVAAGIILAIVMGAFMFFGNR